jgi:hypothetical protein
MKKNHNLWHTMAVQLLDVVVSPSVAALVIEADKKRPPPFRQSIDFCFTGS